MTDIMSTYAAQIRETVAKVIEVIANKVEASPSKQYIWAIIDDVRWIVERIYMNKPVTVDNLKVWNWESGEKKLTDFSMLQLAKLADEMKTECCMYQALLWCKEEGIGYNCSFNRLDCVGRKTYFSKEEAWAGGVEYNKHRWQRDVRYTYWLEVIEQKVSVWERDVERWRQIREELRLLHPEEEEPMLAERADRVYRSTSR